MSFPLAITGTGLVTGVGRDAPASCAARRCASEPCGAGRWGGGGGASLPGALVLGAPLAMLMKKLGK